MLIEPWTIQMFGGLRARQRDRVIERFRTRQVAALFAYLAYFPDRPVNRDALGEMLWPDSDMDHQRQYLRQALYFLRRHLETSGTGVIQSDYAGIKLRAESVLTDVSEFLRRSADSDSENLMSCVELYRGPLLPEMNEPWIEPERQRLRDLYLGSLRRLIRAKAETKEYDSAIEYAHRSVGEDPYREESHSSLIRLYLAVGRPASAKDQYVELAKRMEELGVSPAADIKALVSKFADSPKRSLIPDSQRESQLADTRDSSQNSPRARPLPLPFTRLFGRKDERESVVKLLMEDGIRLVTLTGPGGIGKTRLSLEVARDLLAAFHDSVHFVPLADLRDAFAIPDSIIASLPIERSPNHPPLNQCIGFLSQSPSLLVLDNYERLVPEGKAPILALLKNCPDLWILVTSRTKLRIAGERDFRVPLLAIPEPYGADLEETGSAPSVALFVDRARTARSEFQITPQNTHVVAGICRKLEGLPLAIELAAARISTLSPQQILSGLVDRFRILSTVHIDKSDRHRSLWATIDWSFSLLPADLQQFFARLSVFRGGCNARSAAAVALELPPGTSELSESSHSDGKRRAQELLERLRAHSLIEDEETGGVIRYRMLETIREFSSDQLDAAGLWACRALHLKFFESMGEQFYERRFSADSDKIHAEIALEQDNIRSALAFALDHAPHSALKLSGTIGLSWYFRGNLHEAADWLDRALKQTADTPSPDRARAANLRGLMALDQCDLQKAREMFEESISCRPPESDDRALAATLHNLAQIECTQGNYESADRLFQRAISTAREHDERAEFGLMLSSYGMLHYSMGRLNEAESLCRQGLNVLLGHKETWATGNVLLSLALIAIQREDVAAADSLCQEALKLHGEQGSSRGIGLAYHYLGLSALKQTEYAHAKEYLRKALMMYVELGDKNGIAEALEGVAEALLGENHAVATISLLSFASRLRDELGVPIPEVNKRDHARVMAAARKNAGEPLTEHAGLLGATYSLKEALALARSGPDATQTASHS